MKTTLHLYIIKEQAIPIGVCLLGVSLILVTGRLLQLTRYLFTSSLTAVDLLELVSYAMPKLMLFAFPMAVLLGVLLAFLRMNNDNELVALRAAGISFGGLLAPVLLVILTTTLISFYNSLIVVPSSTKAFEQKLKSVGKANVSVLLREGTFIDAIPKLVFFFKSVDSSNMTVDGVFVQDQRQPDVRMSIVAEGAIITSSRDTGQLVFNMRNGIITRTSEDYRDSQAISFKQYDLTISLDELMDSSRGKGKSKREMSLSELFDISRTAEGRLRMGYALEFHQRLAFPIGCVVLGFIGAPLGALFRQKGRTTGVTMALCIFLVYYVLLSAGKGLGENEIIPPFLAVWFPNLLTAAAAVYLWIKIDQESSSHLVDLMSNLGLKIRNLWPASRRNITSP